MGNFIDLTGKRFGRLLVVGRHGYIKGKYIAWKCLCDCGQTTIVRGSSLRSGNTRSCGCFCKDRVSETKRLYLQEGQKFGRLTVLERSGRARDSAFLWKCLCDCGEIAVVRGVCLVSGHTQSCGCLQRERATATVMGKFGCAHPSWKGGLSLEPYPPEFNEMFKQTVRERDGNVCAICRLQERNGNKLSVHHIDYIKENTTPENCISLCNACHAVTHGNRDYWQDTLSSLLQRRLSYLGECNAS